VRLANGTLLAESRGETLGAWSGDDPGAPQKDTSVEGKRLRAKQNPRVQQANKRWSDAYDVSPESRGLVLCWRSPAVESFLDPAAPFVLDATLVTNTDGTIQLQIAWLDDGEAETQYHSTSEMKERARKLGRPTRY
tara:strand:+ start:354 stop:761 length:408 start_codon:yes stop_codon:yes gene_type:complete